MHNILQHVLQWIYPQTCLLCLQHSNTTSMLCSECIHQLPWQTHSCYQCAMPLPSLCSTATSCGQCLSKSHAFDYSIAAWTYQPPISHFITQLKFNQQLRFAQLLGMLLANYLCEHRALKKLPDCIIPVPLHRQRLCQRGFNQAIEIARPIAKHLQIPLCMESCIRQKNTDAQTNLNSRQRQRNVYQAFTLSTQLAYKHIAIIDDVMTTGATVNALSHTLKLHGIQTVEIWCCARAYRKS